jgi:hypothetical protein
LKAAQQLIQPDASVASFGQEIFANNRAAHFEIGNDSRPDENSPYSCHSPHLLKQQNYYGLAFLFYEVQEKMYFASAIF